jgi:hypothetical protein
VHSYTLLETVRMATGAESRGNGRVTCSESIFLSAFLFMQFCRPRCWRREEDEAELMNNVKLYHAICRMMLFVVSFISDSFLLRTSKSSSSSGSISQKIIQDEGER